MKKFFAFLLLPVMLFAFASCTEAARPDYAMLAKRLGAVNENYAFEYFDMFNYEDTYHVYLSVNNEDDVLLSMHTDDAGNIDDLTVTANIENFKTDAEKNALSDFFTAVINSYCELAADEREELAENLSFHKPESYFTDLYEKYSSLRHNFIFSSNAEFVCLYCEYYEIMDDPTR